MSTPIQFSIRLSAGAMGRIDVLPRILDTRGAYEAQKPFEVKSDNYAFQST